jgi:hypothetical protein
MVGQKAIHRLELFDVWDLLPSPTESEKGIPPTRIPIAAVELFDHAERNESAWVTWNYS